MTEPSSSPAAPVTEEEAFFVDESAHAAYRLAGVVRIGRAPENTIVITDPTVSRLHCEVWTENGRTMLRSLKENGTVINGTRVPGIYMLEEGDRVDLGWTSFQYTTQALPMGVHAASRGIAGASRRSDAPAADVARGDQLRATVDGAPRRPGARVTPRDPLATIDNAAVRPSLFRRLLPILIATGAVIAGLVGYALLLR